MVLWEIAVGTAYFLGLKRTYKLALKLQRRVVPPKHPKIRQFLQRRTRMVFDMALRVHKNIQERDLEVGRNVGNWILRWLDRMKPSAQIRSVPPSIPPTAAKRTKPSGPIQKSNITSADSKSDGRVFSVSLNMRSKSSPWAMMMRPTSSANMQYRQLSIWGTAMPRLHGGISRDEGVIRKDIMQWMLQK